MSPYHPLLDAIDNGDFNKFQNILSDSDQNETISTVTILNRLFNNRKNKSEYFGYLVNNNGKYGWNIRDYTIIVAYCAQKSDFKLLSKIIDNVDKSKYNLNMQFYTFQNFSKWIPENLKFCKTINSQKYKI